ncbi:hypothetical protein [Helicobacter sp. 13S00477-4]|uniref:CCA tRNA nucleotidyltransferase n=1 Tax=Helicobacter sp. 13S00477-4 TaxID=1905759 RepID=UPI000BA7E0D1|nr:hypothetical protein [Helicobacter sp. 13S00477-4]PAF52393.1 hypothetical protein BKH44_02380 [Helicobacter sp. 13S00477-4]
MFEIALPLEVRVIIEALQKADFEAFVVGGCVRDSLLKEQFDEFSPLYPKDWDIATSAKPESIRRVLEPLKIQVIPTGIKHGTISALIGKKIYEITTYRIDGEYIKHRRPKEVFFVSNLKDDLYRRDFTINAMAYHPDIGIFDPFDGKNDLKNKIIKAVGNPNERFKEDALRILRALRFASRFGFEIDTLTKKAIWSHKKLLKFISKERIREEIKGILCGKWAGDVLREYIEIIGFAWSGENNIFERIIHDKEKILQAIAFCPQEFIPRIAILIYESQITLQRSDEILAQLYFDKKTQKTIFELIRHIPIEFVEEKSWIKKYLNILGQQRFKVLLGIKSAQYKSEGKPQGIIKIKKIGIMLEEIIQKNEPFSLKDLAINGYHLKEIGVPRKKIGIMLEAMLEAIIDEKISNRQDELKKFAKGLLGMDRQYG